jgi:glycosyltransferase involved in cell wall biosynthesis
MARAAREAGFEVHVATRVNEGARAIEAEGFTLHAVPFARGHLSPLALAGMIRALRRVYRTVAPEIIHHIALQPSVLGSLSATGLRAARINSITGLGFAYSSQSLKARLIRPFVSLLLRMLFSRQRTVVIVQNEDDRRALEALGVAAGHISLIPGSGVDIDRLQPLPVPLEPLTLGFAGRLLEDKGIHVLMDAFHLLRARHPQLRLLIAGTPDPHNPTSVSESEAKSWNNEPGITWLGHVSDISALWARAHIAVLPSRREGFPKSLLEAAACGRPLIATDVPGCREIAIAGRTGALCQPDNPGSLASAIEDLLASDEKRAAFGKAARDLVVACYSSDIIGRQTVDLYRSLS